MTINDTQPCPDATESCCKCVLTVYIAVVPLPRSWDSVNKRNRGMDAVCREIGRFCYWHLKAEMGDTKVEQ